MQHPVRLLAVALLVLLSGCSLDPQAGEPSPPAAIYLMNADGGGLARVTGETSYDVLPAWSPDARRIAFSRSPRTQATTEIDLFAVDVDGGHETRLTSGPAGDADPAWSPDGKRLAFTRYAGDAGTVMVVDADGSGIRPLTNIGPGAMPSWSPDGRRLAFVRRAGMPVAEPPWWQRTLGAVLSLLVGRLAVGAVVAGVVVCVLKGRLLSWLAGVLAGAAAWVMFTQAPASRQAERVGGFVLGMVLYGGLAALLVGVVRPARPGSRWMRLAQRGGRGPTRNGSARSGSSRS